ncbi:hypothetical protein, conserved [Leishmania donovani]|uniref:Zeta toxin domain-containing protein n=1 Tax=Leishmania donovani TaxID=5661 RepID=E9BT32_LEIDO|nr:hypothetical protein, conserved [Leishmania donovani]TPP44768.1 hypothetical protein CGC21_8005 [Leishmania donovani]CBZ38411.1 hypothetical protein, conserved [Leishmania donovani]
MSSKYDVIKVKVHLSDVHYYVLSRFLLSRMLMFCRVPEDTAVRISLDVKKHFVNTERTSITQAELEDYIRCSMIAAGFAQEHAQLFSVVTQFHAERIPLILFIAGPERCGKTTLAHLLAARINCSTVINAEVLRDISASIDDSLPSFAVSETSSPDSTPSMLRGVEVSAAVGAEVDKAVREGQAIIVEGENLSFAGFHRFLEPSFQFSTGAVILGLVMDTCGSEAETDASHAYVKALPNLQPVFSTERLTVFAADMVDLAKGVSGIPTVYVARCTTVADNVCLSVFLHDIVVKRIIAELKRRGRML